MSWQSQIPLYHPPHSFKSEPTDQPAQELSQSSTFQLQQPRRDAPVLSSSNAAPSDFRPNIYRPSHYQDFQQHQQALQERKDSVAPLTIDTGRPVNDQVAEPTRSMAVHMLPQRHMYPTLGSSAGYSYGQSRSLLYDNFGLTSARDLPTHWPAEYGYYYGPMSQNLAYAQQQSSYTTNEQALYGPLQTPQTTSPFVHARYDSGAAVPDITRFGASSAVPTNKPITTSIQENKLESNTSAPGPIPATTPLVVRQDSDGVQWIAFQYSRDRIKLEYTIRCDVESVAIDELDENFKSNNCVYPRACGTKRSEYKGNRLQYETECNAVGWALAKLNPELREKRGLIQRAVDSWRNSNSDPKLRSRRVRRQNKANARAKVNKNSTLWRMQSMSDMAPSPDPSVVGSPSPASAPDQTGHISRHSDTSIDYTSHPTTSLYPTM